MQLKIVKPVCHAFAIALMPTLNIQGFWKEGKYKRRLQIRVMKTDLLRPSRWGQLSTSLLLLHEHRKSLYFRERVAWIHRTLYRDGFCFQH